MGRSPFDWAAAAPSARIVGLLAEMVLLLRGELQTQEVDWLFWEDPFIEGRDADELRLERELSRDETVKRLRANAPIIRLLLDQIEQHDEP